MSRHAVVTGSSGGIGAAVCRYLTDSGWTVTGLDVADPPGGGWRHVPCDLGVSGQAAAGAAAARESSGPVTAIVHCAAVQALGGAGAISGDDWRQTLQVNVVALDELVGACRDDLVAHRGAVVAISSVHAKATTRGIAAYATSKAALNGWVRAAALDLAPHVRVNAIQPGAVRTGMLLDGLARRPDEGSPDQALEALAARTPLGAVAEPADIAAAVGALLDPAVTRFMTGVTLPADGGALIHLSTE
ncbi:MAG TPA: SDR family oxidoreductase [Egibacteraceae bacterium]|nr:SDR family oxidoreductase [Egibacteraceae bacterium]